MRRLSGRPSASTSFPSSPIEPIVDAQPSITSESPSERPTVVETPAEPPASPDDDFPADLPPADEENLSVIQLEDLVRASMIVIYGIPAEGTDYASREHLQQHLSSRATRDSSTPAEDATEPPTPAESTETTEREVVLQNYIRRLFEARMRNNREELGRLQRDLVNAQSERDRLQTALQESTANLERARQDEAALRARLAEESVRVAAGLAENTGAGGPGRIPAGAVLVIQGLAQLSIVPDQEDEDERAAYVEGNGLERRREAVMSDTRPYSEQMTERRARRAAAREAAENGDSSLNSQAQTISRLLT